MTNHSARIAEEATSDSGRHSNLQTFPSDAISVVMSGNREHFLQLWRTMLNKCNYKEDGTYGTYARAKKRKMQLKEEGFRVKIQKTVDGEFAVWVKDVTTIGLENRQGNGREGWT